jgi:hypothetical protein
MHIQDCWTIKNSSASTRSSPKNLDGITKQRMAHTMGLVRCDHSTIETSIHIVKSMRQLNTSQIVMVQAARLGHSIRQRIITDEQRLAEWQHITLA